jgi:hypothetical protein
MSIADASMRAPLRWKRARLCELKDRWSQPPIRKVEDTAVASQWAAVMVGYDEYENLRRQATIRATRIWRQHEWDHTIWPAFIPIWGGEDNKESTLLNLPGTLVSDCASDDEVGTPNAAFDDDDTQLAQLEDLCEDLSHIYYT